MMTKPELQEKLIRKPTSLPPRISSYGHIVGDNNGNNNSKWNEYIYKFFHALSTIIQFCSPLVIMMAILYDSIIVAAVAFGLFLSKILVLDLFLSKVGKIQNWPNKFDMIAGTVMVPYGISGLMISRTNQFIFVFNIVIFDVLTASIGVAWLLFGYPIGRAIVSAKVEDMVPFTHPVVIHFIQLTSGVMLCTSFLTSMLLIAAKVEYDHGGKNIASAFIRLGCNLFICMIFVISWYGFYFNTNIEKIAAKYKKEISKQMDNKYHPNNNNNSNNNDEKTTTTKLEMQAILINDNYIV